MSIKKQRRTKIAIQTGGKEKHTFYVLTFNARKISYTLSETTQCFGIFSFFFAAATPLF